MVRILVDTHSPILVIAVQSVGNFKYLLDKWRLKYTSIMYTD